MKLFDGNDTKVIKKSWWQEEYERCYAVWNEEEEDRSWEYMSVLSPVKRTWVRVRIKGMPRIKCVAILANCKVGAKDIFLLGEDQKSER